MGLISPVLTRSLARSICSARSVWFAPSAPSGGFQLPDALVDIDHLKVIVGAPKQWPRQLRAEVAVGVVVTPAVVFAGLAEEHPCVAHLAED